MRSRPAAARREGRAAARRPGADRRPGVQGGAHRGAIGADRRLRRHGFHSGQIRCCDPVCAGAAGGHRLGDDGDLHPDRAGHAVPCHRHPPVRSAAAAAHRAAGGDRHVLVGDGDSWHDGEAAGGRCRPRRGRARHPRRLFLQSRRRGADAAAEHAVHRPGLRDRDDAGAAGQRVRGDAVHQQGRGRRHRWRLRGIGGHCDRRRPAGRRAGAAAGCRPLHVAGASRHQHHRQCGRRHRRRQVGRRVRPAGLGPIHPHSNSNRKVRRL